MGSLLLSLPQRMFKILLIELAKNPPDFASLWRLIFTIDLPSEGHRVSPCFTINDHGRCLF